MRRPTGPRAVRGPLALMPALLLTGCIVPGHLATTTVPSESSPGVVSSPVPTITDGPVPRVPVMCDEVAAVETVRALLTLDAVEPIIRRGDTLAVSAMAQIGALECEWISPVRVPGGPRLSVRIVPGYPAEFRQEVEALPAAQSDECGSTSCESILWTDDYGVEVSLKVPDNAQADPAGFRELGRAVIGKLESHPPPPPLWVPTEWSAYAEARSCDDLIDPLTVIEATGAGSGLAEFQGPSSQLAMRAAPKFLVGQIDCRWADFSVSLLPGGSWAFERGLEVATDSYLVVQSDCPKSTRTTVDGDGAVLASRGRDFVEVVSRTDWDPAVLQSLAEAALAKS